MESGVNYLVSHAYCKNCDYKWTAIIEVEYIELIGKKEYKLPEEIRLKLSRAKIGKYLGNKNPFADLNEYTFVRLVDGFEVTCTRSDLCKNFGVSNSYIEKLFYKNNPRKSTSGWRLK